MVSKLSPQQADELSYQIEMDIREKPNFLLFSLQLKNEEMGPTGEMMLTYRATNALLTKVIAGPF